MTHTRALRILIAPDKFKGSLTAVEAAEAIARGVTNARPDATPVLMPIADGGEGTAEAIVTARGGSWVALTVSDPMGRPIVARYVWLEEEIAMVDMSEASGLWRVSVEERDPMAASTFGTGQLMADAIRRGAKTILVGLGGSATNDGGIGMAEALGFGFFDRKGTQLEAIPANLADLSSITPPSEPLRAIVIGLCIGAQTWQTGDRICRVGGRRSAGRGGFRSCVCD